MNATESHAATRGTGRNTLLQCVLSLITFFCAVTFFLSVLLLAQSPGAEAGKTAPDRPLPDKKTLNRHADPVIVAGELLVKNLHRQIGRLALYAAIDGDVRPIPFQIDEVDDNGEWVLSSVPPGLADEGVRPDCDEDHGKLDENDELVFMIRDTGGRIRPESYPPGAAAVDEIVLTDPVTGETAWAYLCGFRSDAPRTEEDYVEYLFPENLVKSVDYTAGFSPGTAFCPGTLSLWDSGNIIDRMKIRLSLKTFGFHYSLDETKLDSELSLYKDGPVRVIRRVRNSIKITNTLRSPSAGIENIFYDNAISLPMRIQIPISPRILRALVSSLKLSGSVDLQNIHGWRVKTNTDPGWLTVDGRMDYLESNLKTEGATWFLLDGPRGALLYRIVLDRRPDGSLYRQPITTSLLYVDDDQLLDPPEGVPGQSPNVGFWLQNLEDISQGMLYLYTTMFMIEDYQEGMEEDYLKIFDHPVRIRVQ